MTVRNSSIHVIGSIDNKTYYFDSKEKQILLYQQNNNSPLIFIGALVTATILGGWAKYLGERFIIDSHFMRFALLIFVYILMSLTAKFVSTSSRKKLVLQPVIVDKYRLLDILAQAKKQIILLRLTVFLFYIILAVTSIIIMETASLGLFILFLLSVFITEMMRYESSPRLRKRTLIQVEKELLADE